MRVVIDNIREIGYHFYNRAYNRSIGCAILTFNSLAWQQLPDLGARLAYALRKTIEVDPTRLRILLTELGVGYRLVQ
jgi:hypothetical protein